MSIPDQIAGMMRRAGAEVSPRKKGALKRARTPKAKQRARAKKIEILRSPVLQAGGVVHGFSTRSGGCSTVFGGRDLNLGGSQDDAAIITKNREAFIHALGGGEWKPARVKQIHSGHIHVIASGRPKPAAGDGLITDKPGLLLSVLVADCVPVLVADGKRRVVGAFHAGWRGTVKRIVERGVGDMRMLFGSRPEDLRAVIGPCVGACCYAVGEEVIDEFHSQFAYAGELFHEVYDDDPVKKKYPLLFLTARAPGHSNIGPQIHLDLVEANRRQLLDAGLRAENIDAMRLCTSCDNQRFFSHRKEQGFTGRMMAVIGLR
jgi:YfiH family protein